MARAEPLLRPRRGRSRPPVWSPLWSLACGIVSAAPQPSLLLLARLTAAAWITGTLWSRLWSTERADDASPPAPPSAGALRSLAIDLWLLGAIALLVNARAMSWLVVSAFLLVAVATLRRKAPAAHLAADLTASVARVALPGWLGWLAATADRQITPDTAIAMSSLSGLGPTLRLYALPLAVWSCFTLVDFSFSAQGGGRGERRWRGPLLLSAYLVLALVLADHGRGLVAAAILMLAATQLPMLGVLDHGRRRWYAQAAQPITVLALLTAAAAIALR